MQQPDADGNYSSPPLTAVQKCWDAYLEGQAELEDLTLTLQAYMDRVHFELNGLDAQVVQGVSNPKDAVFSAIVSGFERQLEAVEEMALELEEPEQGHMEAGMLMAQRANNLLAQAHQRLLARVEELGNVNCPFCATANPRDSERCGQCLRSLPQLAAEAPKTSFSFVQADGLQGTSQGPMTENARELTQAVEAYRQEQMDWEELYTVLDEIEDRLMQHQEENQKLLEGTDRSGLLQRTDDALNKSLEGLDYMRLAWEKEDDSYLDTGLTQFYSASEELLQVLDQMKELQAQ
jgi:hypothetical protein